ncbi:unnamed protein product, partial [Prorocentrum cordatum]
GRFFALRGSLWPRSPGGREGGPGTRAGRASRGRNRRRRAPAGRRGRGGGAHRQAGLADKDRQGVEAELPTGRLAWPMKNEQVIDAQSALLRLMSAEPPQAALALPERL